MYDRVYKMSCLNREELGCEYSIHLLHSASNNIHKFLVESSIGMKSWEEECKFVSIEKVGTWNISMGIMGRQNWILEDVAQEE